jgi:hypothetical protein
MRRTHAGIVPSSFSLDYLYDKSDRKHKAFAPHEHRWHYVEDI